MAGPARGFSPDAAGIWWNKESPVSTDLRSGTSAGFLSDQATLSRLRRSGFRRLGQGLDVLKHAVVGPVGDRIESGSPAGGGPEAVLVQGVVAQEGSAAGRRAGWDCPRGVGGLGLFLGRNCRTMGF